MSVIKPLGKTWWSLYNQEALRVEDYRDAIDHLLRERVLVDESIPFNPVPFRIKGFGKSLHNKHRRNAQSKGGGR